MLPLFSDWLGWLGFGLCFACWFPQTLETIRAGSSALNTRFLFLNLGGCLTLILHSAARGDLPFVVLNCVCALGGAINLWYARRRVAGVQGARRRRARCSRPSRVKKKANFFLNEIAGRGIEAHLEMQRQTP